LHSVSLPHVAGLYGGLAAATQQLLSTGYLQLHAQVLMLAAQLVPVHKICGSGCRSQAMYQRDFFLLMWYRTEAKGGSTGGSAQLQRAHCQVLLPLVVCAVKNKVQFFVLRLLLGVSESGAFPGMW
jgi:hypothetical protein